MVYVWFLNHGAHRPLDAAVFELVESMFVPNGFKVECRAAHKGFEEGEVSGVRYGFGGVVEGGLEGKGEGGGCGGWVEVFREGFCPRCLPGWRPRIVDEKWY